MLDTSTCPPSTSLRGSSQRSKSTVGSGSVLNWEPSTGSVDSWSRRSQSPCSSRKGHSVCGQVGCPHGRCELHSQQMQGAVGFQRKLCTEVVHWEGFDRGKQEGRCHRQRETPRLCSWPGSGMGPREIVRLAQQAAQGRHEKDLGTARGGTPRKKP